MGADDAADVPDDTGEGPDVCGEGRVVVTDDPVTLLLCSDEGCDNDERAFFVF